MIIFEKWFILNLQHVQNIVEFINLIYLEHSKLIVKYLYSFYVFLERLKGQLYGRTLLVVITIVITILIADKLTLNKSNLKTISFVTIILRTYIVPITVYNAKTLIFVKRIVAFE